MELFRPKECLVLGSEKCKICTKKEQHHLQYEKKKKEKPSEPAKPNAPISTTSAERIKLTMQSYRLENKQL